MSNVTASMVKELRDRTGVGMGKCKKALDEANGDIEEAINVLRKSGMASAVKKESRETNEGMIASAEDDQAVVLIEVNAETDFVVQNERFQEFVKMLSGELLKHKATTAEAFLQCKSDNGMTIDELRADQIQSMGENLQVRRVMVLEKASDKSFGVYSHMGGKILAVVELAGANDQQSFARDLGMHVAAEFPEYLAPEDVPAEVKGREQEIAREQVKSKPAQIQDKIVEGKLGAFYDQNCFIRQKYIRDPSKKVEEVVAAHGKEVGKELKVASFLRWQVGA